MTTGPSWETATTLADLGARGADLFEQTAAEDHDDARTWLILADLNRSGFVTINVNTGRDAAGLPTGTVRRAAVQGFCDSLTLEWLTSSLYNTRFQALAVTNAPTTVGDLNHGVPVTKIRGRVTVVFGRQLTAEEIRTFYGPMSPTAVKALYQSWNVTIFDPEWGPNILWDRLAQAADPEPMYLHRRRRQALPAA